VCVGLVLVPVGPYGKHVLLAQATSRTFFYVIGVINDDATVMDKNAFLLLEVQRRTAPNRAVLRQSAPFASKNTNKLRQTASFRVVPC
jgi:hypothetical protein